MNNSILARLPPLDYTLADVEGALESAENDGPKLSVLLGIEANHVLLNDFQQKFKTYIESIHFHNYIRPKLAENRGSRPLSCT